MTSREDDVDGAAGGAAGVGSRGASAIGGGGGGASTTGAGEGVGTGGALGAGGVGCGVTAAVCAGTVDRERFDRVPVLEGVDRSWGGGVATDGPPEAAPGTNGSRRSIISAGNGSSRATTTSTSAIAPACSAIDSASPSQGRRITDAP